jgi:hypothetical protein
MALLLAAILLLQTILLHHLLEDHVCFIRISIISEMTFRTPVSPRKKPAATTVHLSVDALLGLMPVVFAMLSVELEAPEREQPAYGQEQLWDVL